MRAAIVAGGLGTRARALIGDDLPKALLAVAGVPVLLWQLRWLARENVHHVTVLAGHLAERLTEPCDAEAARLGLTVEIVVESQPLGTAGCLGALPASGEELLIVNGDMVGDLDVSALAAFHRAHQALMTIVVHPNDHPATSDLVAETDGRVTAILPRNKRPAGDYRNLVPAGVFLAASPFLARVAPGRRSDLVAELLPALVAGGELIAAYNTAEYLRDVGTPAGHAAAERDIASGRLEAYSRRCKRPALFFDCDGVLNEDPPGQDGVLKPDQVVPIPGAGRAVKRAHEAGYLNIVATNRAQVAKGYITFDDLARILGRVETLMAKEGGVLDRIYFCPHHPEKGFPGEVPELKIACECRKPGALMLRRAADELPIDLTRSALIGDSLRDIGAARGAGIWAYGVRTGYACRDRARYPGGVVPTPDLMFDDVGEAVDFAVEYRTMAAPVLKQLDALRKPSGHPLLITISGRPRAGKSALAHAVARSLAERGAKPPLLVSLDQWIVPATVRGPDDTAASRNGVALYRSIFASLRQHAAVTAPGYDAQTRESAAPVTFDSKGYDVILVDGVLAGEDSVRDLIDIAVHVDVPPALQHQRFKAFYRWKGLAEAEIDALWARRAGEEWTTADAQRAFADLVIGAPDP